MDTIKIGEKYSSLTCGKTFKNLQFLRCEETLQKFLPKLIWVENYNSESYSVFGHDECGTCNTDIGGIFYSTTNEGVKYEWRSGYKHFIIAHGIEPDTRFKKMIEDKYSRKIKNITRPDKKERKRRSKSRKFSTQFRFTL